MSKTSKKNKSDSSSEEPSSSSEEQVSKSVSSDQESESSESSSVEKPKKQVVRKTRAAPARGTKRKAPARKKKKDPNAPKRPLTAYMFFTKERRTEYAKEHPEMKFGDLSKGLAEVWKNLGPVEKANFETMHEKDKKKIRKGKEKVYSTRRII